MIFNTKMHHGKLDNYVSDPYRLLAESHAILPMILIRNL